METLEQVQTVVARQVHRGGGRVVARGYIQKRAPSDEARRANEALRGLRRYFRTQAQLQRALHWSAPTLRSWIIEEGPARPRAHSVEQVLLLYELASAAGRWVSDPFQVGEWVLEPNESMGNVTPAQVLEVLGNEGVQLLIEHMAVIAPRERISPDDVDLDPDALRETLKQLGTPPITDIEGSGEVDLSDLDFD